MGGVKKRPVSQMETGLSGASQERKKGKSKATVERKMRGISIPNVDEKSLLKDLSKLGAITPYALASKYDLRLSVAKQVLSELEKRELIKLEEGNRRIKVFRFVGA